MPVLRSTCHGKLSFFIPVFFASFVLVGNAIGLGLGWRASQYFFSYQELGFVRRGLPATLLYPFPWLSTIQGINAVYWFILASFGMAIVLLCHEAAIVINLPLVLVYQWKVAQPRSLNSLVESYRWLLMPLLTFVSLILWGA